MHAKEESGYDHREMKLSIVVPTWNEAGNLGATLAALPAEAEVVVSDGGSTDGTRAVAEAAGARFITGPRGRAIQMNRGAAVTTGDVILFLHADGVLGEGVVPAIDGALESPGVVGGSFRLHIDTASSLLRFVAKGSNFRASTLGMPYGDQGLFVTRSAFDEVAGFPDVPFLEDVGMVRKLKRIGRLARLDVPVRTSARHWQERGVVGTTLMNWTVVALYVAGVDPRTLAPHYQKWRAQPD
jgi:rSAM/selenodomain-associated transferase 2